MRFQTALCLIHHNLFRNMYSETCRCECNLVVNDTPITFSMSLWRRKHDVRLRRIFKTCGKVHIFCTGCHMFWNAQMWRHGNTSTMHVCYMFLKCVVKLMFSVLFAVHSEKSMCECSLIINTMPIAFRRCMFWHAFFMLQKHQTQAEKTKDQKGPGATLWHLSQVE